MNKTSTLTKAPEVEIPMPNTLKVYMPGGLTLCYSYQTCVGFVHKGERVFTNASFSNTTARHLKSVFMSEKKERVEPEIFEQRLSEALNSILIESE